MTVASARDGPRYNRRIVHGYDGQPSRALSTSGHDALQVRDDMPQGHGLALAARPGQNVCQWRPPNRGNTEA